jgi:hypothetical protein
MGEEGGMVSAAVGEKGSKDMTFLKDQSGKIRLSGK